MISPAKTRRECLQKIQAMALMMMPGAILWNPEAPLFVMILSTMVLASALQWASTRKSDNGVIAVGVVAPFLFFFITMNPATCMPFLVIPILIARELRGGWTSLTLAAWCTVVALAIAASIDMNTVNEVVSVLGVVPLAGALGAPARKIVRTTPARKPAQTPSVASVAAPEQKIQDITPEPIQTARPVSPVRLAPAVEKKPDRKQITTWIQSNDLMNRMGNNRMLLKELQSLFQSENQRQLNAMRLALSNNDARSFSRAAHAIKSGLSNFCSPEATALAETLEHSGRAGRLDGMLLDTNILERCLQDITNELDVLCAEGAA